MRKSFVILIALVSFGLGLASQSLFAGGPGVGWEYPPRNSASPVLSEYGYFGADGWTIYKIPENYKLLNANASSEGNISIQFAKKVGTN